MIYKNELSRIAVEVYHKNPDLCRYMKENDGTKYGSNSCRDRDGNLRPMILGLEITNDIDTACMLYNNAPELTEEAKEHMPQLYFFVKHLKYNLENFEEYLYSLKLRYTNISKDLDEIIRLLQHVTIEQFTKSVVQTDENIVKTAMFFFTSYVKHPLQLASSYSRSYGHAVLRQNTHDEKQADYLNVKTNPIAFICDKAFDILADWHRQHKIDKSDKEHMLFRYLGYQKAAVFKTDAELLPKEYVTRLNNIKSTIKTLLEVTGDNSINELDIVFRKTSSINVNNIDSGNNIIKYVGKQLSVCINTIKRSENRDVLFYELIDMMCNVFLPFVKPYVDKRTNISGEYDKYITSILYTAISDHVQNNNGDINLLFKYYDVIETYLVLDIRDYYIEDILRTMYQTLKSTFNNEILLEVYERLLLMQVHSDNEYYNGLSRNKDDILRYKELGFTSVLELILDFGRKDTVITLLKTVKDYDLHLKVSLRPDFNDYKAFLIKDIVSDEARFADIELVDEAIINQCATYYIKHKRVIPLSVIPKLNRGTMVKALQSTQTPEQYADMLEVVLEKTPDEKNKHAFGANYSGSACIQFDKVIAPLLKYKDEEISGVTFNRIINLLDKPYESWEARRKHKELINDLPAKLYHQFKTTSVKMLNILHNSFMSSYRSTSDTIAFSSGGYNLIRCHLFECKEALADIANPESLIRKFIATKEDAYATIINGTFESHLASSYAICEAYGNKRVERKEGNSV